MFLHASVQCLCPSFCLEALRSPPIILQTAFSSHPFGFHISSPTDKFTEESGPWLHPSRALGPFPIPLLVPVSSLPILGLSSVTSSSLVLFLPMVAYLLDHILDSFFSETSLPPRFLPDHNLRRHSPSLLTINLLPYHPEAPLPLPSPFFWFL